MSVAAEVVHTEIGRYGRTAIVAASAVHSKGNIFNYTQAAEVEPLPRLYQIVVGGVRRTIVGKIEFYRFAVVCLSGQFDPVAGSEWCICILFTVAVCTRTVYGDIFYPSIVCNITTSDANYEIGRASCRERV